MTVAAPTCNQITAQGAATGERYQVSTTTVLRWSRRYRQVVAEGVQRVAGRAEPF